MARTKLKRLKKLKELPNIFTLEDEEVDSAIQQYFKIAKTFTLEIGCGHGDYSIELAKKFSNRNFVGLDLKGARIFTGALDAFNQNLKNVAFIIGKAEKLNEIFPAESIEEIFIPFPDPHVRRRKVKKRLISLSLLKIYQDLLTESGIIHFKTDNEELYEYALKNISKSGCKILFSSGDVYDGNNSEISSGMLTKYEKHYINLGRKIKYIRFRF